MAQLAAQKPRIYGTGFRAYKGSASVKASVKVFEGSALGDDAAGAARQLVAGDPFLGFAFRDQDNSAGAVGDKKVDLIERGEIEIPVTGATGIADVGDTVYASDGDTFTKVATSNSSIGKIKRYVSGTTCVVEFEAVQVRSL